MDAVSVLQTVLAAIQSGSVSFNGTEVNTANATVPSPTAAAITPLSLLQLPTLIAHVLSLSVVRDWLKLFLIGGALEICRRLLTSSWSAIKNYFWITVTLEEGDDCGYWLLYWLSKHQVFRTARTLDVSTRTFRIDAPVVSDSGEDDTTKGRNISFLPSLDTTYYLWYKYHYVTVTRNQVNDGPWQTKQTLRIQMLARNHDVLRGLLLEAKKHYANSSENMISIYVSTSDYWKLMCTQHKRPMKSIILDPGMIDLVLNDAKDFLASKEWYAERGIPHRRGYLLYGAPGAGKTSLIHSIAGELNLDVYILSLTRLGMDDSTLNSVIAELPDKCIVLVEDIDAAFHKGIKRDIVDPEKQHQEGPESQVQTQQDKDSSDSVTSRITLSGLLNALDGIGAQEGRILFATTNDYKALDPALCRPGRLDLHVEFKLASKYQCRELFRRFYLPSGGNKDEKDEEKEQTGEKDSGYSSPSGSVSSSATPATSPSPSAPSSSPSTSSSDSESSATYVGITHSSRGPKLSPKKAAELADRFAALVPNRAFSMATLQGYLMTYKTRPYDAVDDVSAWVEKKKREQKAGARSDAPPSGSSDGTSASSGSSSAPAEAGEEVKTSGEDEPAP
ncbi:P-loop containing nucleoside triphosphate hydrolase protein [Lentinus tigrinus ALCF2SS1-7]|uniref:P-loop containing nucleoside triphosphate hydrolase protein n=1 Tax=Lentinus tigrinus ALCF2SS1-6 TaxID=1328759 RepID=A0A5C2S7A0_9APHY|nr:P-loop containing nucleoside triphosphate hydrolase protein [Lentinus tigrinus ALCF2SS1-6]RPD73304.1 P-loop containing nucleoside triphosphate hydrolase protein [Lentinus tigrinus ALCF2SS1-7]